MIDQPTTLDRRSLLRGAAGMSLAATTSTWSQTPRLAGNARSLTVVQLVDTSASQQDVSRDFLIGSRAAWQDINLKGGVRGRPVEHLSLEVDGSPASLRAALDAFKTLPHAVVLSGIVQPPVDPETLALFQAADPAVGAVDSATAIQSMPQGAKPAGAEPDKKRRRRR